MTKANTLYEEEQSGHALFAQIPPKPDVLIIRVYLKDIPTQPGEDHLLDQIQQNLQNSTSIFQGSRSLLPLCRP